MTNAERENAIRCLKLWIEREPQLQTYKTCLEALEQQSDRNIKEIEEVMQSDADAETKCKMISNILTAKPHYFELDCDEFEPITPEEMQKCKDIVKKYTPKQQPCDKCVYSTKDGYCQYDDITETIPPLDPCDEAVSRQAALNSLIDNTNLEGYDLAEALDAIDNKEKLPPVTPQQKTGHTEQWQELKETITEMRDNNGTGTQQEVCKFLVNLMDVLEKQMINSRSKNRDIDNWIKSHDSYGNNHFTCPFCELDIATKADTLGDNYCYNCGARLLENEE